MEKVDNHADYYYMRLRIYKERGKKLMEAVKLAQADVKKWLKEKQNI